MPHTPQSLRYARTTHEWVKCHADNELVIGITDYAQDALGDIVYVELPTVGEHFDADQVFGSIESVKTASDIYMPLSGTVVAVNSELEENPEWVNEDPYQRGWLIKVKPDLATELDQLRTAEQYMQASTA